MIFTYDASTAINVSTLVNLVNIYSEDREADGHSKMMLWSSILVNRAQFSMATLT